MPNFLTIFRFPVIFVFMLTGCKFFPIGDGSDDPVADPNSKTKVNLSAFVLQKPQTCDEFRGYLIQTVIEQTLENNGGYWGQGCFACEGGFLEDGSSIRVDFPASSGSTGSGGSSSGGGGGVDVSTGEASSSDASTSNPGSVTKTNNQEQGVDELDKVKTDSDGNIYLISDKELFFIKAFPSDELNTISKLELAANDNPFGLFIDEENKRLMVLSYHWEERAYNEILDEAIGVGIVGGGGKYFYSQQQFLVTVVDINDLSAPEIKTEMKIDGSMISARYINNRLHVVVSHAINNVDESYATRKFYKDLDDYWSVKSRIDNFPSLQEDLEKLRISLAQRITDGINTLDLDTIFPSYQKSDQEETALLSCTNVYHPQASLKTSSMLSVISMDSDTENMTTSGALASGGMVYASLSALYVAQPSYGWWSNTPNQTAIHKFAFTDDSTLYSASGLVKGTPNNTFSFSEFNDYLRIATTEDTFPDDARQPTRTNHLFVLGDDNEGLLNQVGSVEDYGKDESIHSARFLGDRGYVVTFRQTDPLFAFDLSNPEAPELKGELEIPGFSTYMHPIDENHLLTIGRAGTEDGRIQETQLQLFDVSDMTNPVRLFTHIPEVLEGASRGSGYSPAEYDHHAFTYVDEEKILSIPISAYRYFENDGNHFSGIATFKLDIENGISENGMVDHSDLIEKPDDCVSEEDVITENGKVIIINESNRVCYDYYYRGFITQPDRSIVMRDESAENSYLYSVSRLGIKVNDLNNMETELNKLVLRPK